MDKIKAVADRLRKWNRIFCAGMTCKTNLKRDIVTISLLIAFSALFILGDRYLLEKQVRQAGKISGIQDAKNLSEQEVYQEVAVIQEKIDTSKWSNYLSNWYGFVIKYPQSWKKPVGVNAPKGAKWEYRFQFRRPDSETEKAYAGFDVVIYDVSRTKELSGTEEFPMIKNEELKSDPKCATLDGRLIETGDYPAEEIYVPVIDDCFNATLFFTFIKDKYIYNIVPVLKSGAEAKADPRIAINDDFPEFLSAISTASMTEIVRPKVNVAPPKPKITAPKPVSYRVDSSGRLVCAKKNDKPSKSNKNKKRHLDLECCLDPDEIPNPWCYYSASKYGKYLK